MSAVITGVLKFTFGLLSKQVRAYGARKLQNGGLADREFRNLIVRELDDIKSSLHGLSVTELYNSISCLNQGVDRLNMSFEDSVDGTGRQSPLPHAIQKQSEDSLTSTESCDGLIPDIDQIFTLAHTVSKLKNVANKRYESAEESFKNAAIDASRAFHNPNLSIEERVLACKVRIASGIFQHLDDPDLAASDCKQYLNELHAIICTDFTVHAKGGLKSYYKSSVRADVVESVIEINLFLLDFITTFTNKGKTLKTFDWPLIKCDINTYHPIYYEASTMTTELTRITPPWCIKYRGLLRYRGLSAVNSRGDLILCPDTSQTSLVKFDRETRQLQDFKNADDQDVKRNYLVVDEDDTVYLLTRYNQKNHYNLSVCDANGNINGHHPLEFMKGKDCCCFGITNDKRFVFCCEFGKNENILYISDCNGQLKNSFPAQISDNRIVKDIFCSSSGEIILVAVKTNRTSSTIGLNIHTVEGQCQEPAKVVNLKLPEGSGSPSSCTVRYNYLTNNFICLAPAMMGGVTKYLEFSQTGELESLCDLNIKHLGFNNPNLNSHPKGTVALTCQNGVLYM